MKKNKYLYFTLLSVAITIAFFLLISLLFWDKLDLNDRRFLLKIIKENGGYLFICFLFFCGGVGFLADALLNIFFIPLNKITDETALIISSNPSHRIKTEGGKSILNLANLINEIADEYDKLKTDVSVEIEAAKTAVEKEKNILASFMEQLPYGALACNAEGKIILFNKEAKIIESKSHFIGIGRSISGIIDKEFTEHALYEANILQNKDNIAASSSFFMVTDSQKLIKVQASPITGNNNEYIGFILFLYDMTAEIALVKKAVESEAGYLGYMKKRMPLITVSDRDIMATFRKRAKEQLNVDITTEFSEKSNWIKVESYSFILALLFIIIKFREKTGLIFFHCKVAREKNMLAVLFLLPDDETAKTVVSSLNQPVLTADNKKILITLSEIINYNEGILTIDSSCIVNRTYLKLLMPIVEIGEPKTIQGIDITNAKQEFYNFDLLTKHFKSRRLNDYPLKELAYTVFDTETTGLNTQTDEIISIAAVRIVNNKLLYKEKFEELVNPGIRIPWEAEKIHGINDSMVKDKLNIKKVLNDFYNFAEDTVLLAHNAGFDMKLLQAKEKDAKLKFDNPVLDTMILSAAVYPTHQRHDLKSIAQLVGVKIKGRHTAAGDALAAAEIFLKLIPLLEKKNIFTLKEAIEVSKKTIYSKLKY
ncbi:MAG: 3'-5' exoribonuclease [Deltaproteobacteria bacterium]|nr:3'-5' exoribonuclease [Deltaproteobacteria bacterium]